jgi:hypothetical protein
VEFQLIGLCRSSRGGARVRQSKTMTLLVLAIFCQTFGEIRFAMDLAMVIW